MTASSTAYKLRREKELLKEAELLAKQKQETFLRELMLEALPPAASLAIKQKPLSNMAVEIANDYLGEYHRREKMLRKIQNQLTEILMLQKESRENLAGDARTRKIQALMIHALKIVNTSLGQ